MSPRTKQESLAGYNLSVTDIAQSILNINLKDLQDSKFDLEATVFNDMVIVSKL